MRHARRGYSLIEMALSMAIAGIITAAALSTYSVVNSQIIQLRTEAGLESKLQRTLAGFAADMQEIGGGPVRPWHAVFVRPGDEDSKGSDSILGVTVDGEFTSAPCPVTAYGGTIIVVGEALDDPQPPLPPGSPPATHCCLLDGNYNGRFAAITKTGDAVIVGLDGATVNAAACTINAETLFEPERIDPAHSWHDATMTVVSTKWVALDHSDHTLNAYMLRYKTAPPVRPGQTPPDLGIVLKSETRTLARDIYDFQVSLGYDVDFDGVVEEAPGGEDDEWFGNDRDDDADSENWLNDEREEGDGGIFPSNSFRMMEIGLLVGTRTKMARVRGNQAVLDGPDYPIGGGDRCDADHTKLTLRSGRARVLLRSSGVYE